MKVEVYCIPVFNCPACGRARSYEWVREKHRSAKADVRIRCEHCGARHMVTSTSNESLSIEPNVRKVS
jgi:uncharacterized Zn finger protein